MTNSPLLPSTRPKKRKQLTNAAKLCEIAAPLLLLFSLGCKPTRNDFLQQVAEMAGPHAVDCGYAKPQDDPQSLMACAQAAVSHNRPFKVLLERRGIDSKITSALLRTPDGELFELTYDSDKFGGSRPIAAPEIRKHSCKNLLIVHYKPDNRPSLECS